MNPLGTVAGNIPSNSSVNNDSSNNPVVSAPRSEVNVLSKYLVLPATSTPSGPKKAPPHLHLLTSAETLAISAEKEQKAERSRGEGAEEEGKERKKRQREKECKWKAEEKARKAKEREEEKARGKSLQSRRKTSERSGKEQKVPKWQGLV